MLLRANSRKFWVGPRIALPNTSLTPYNVVSPGNIMVTYLANKSPSIYRTRIFIVVFVRPPLLILVLSQTNFIHTFQSYILTRILIISSHLRFRLLIVPHSSGFTTKILFKLNSFKCMLHALFLSSFLI